MPATQRVCHWTDIKDTLFKHLSNAANVQDSNEVGIIYE